MIDVKNLSAGYVLANGSFAFPVHFACKDVGTKSIRGMANLLAEFSRSVLTVAESADNGDADANLQCALSYSIGAARCLLDLSIALYDTATSIDFRDATND